MSPKTLNSHMITTITTTTFNIFLMVDCIGYVAVNDPQDHPNDNQNDH